MAWITRRDPFNELRSVQEDLNRIFNYAVPGLIRGEESLGGRWTPAVDIFEDDNSIVLEADLPGVKAGDFKLHIENFKLTLSGERKPVVEGGGDSYHRVERSYGAFTRTFSLPSTVNVEGVKAELREGVLRVTLPKREEVKARQIEVSVKSEPVAGRAMAAEGK